MTTVQNPIAMLLALAFPDRHSPKRIAQAASVSLRAAHYWRAGVTDMPASRLWRLAERNQKFRAELMRALGEMDRHDSTKSDAVAAVSGGASVAAMAGDVGREAGRLDRAADHVAAKVVTR